MLQIQCNFVHEEAQSKSNCKMFPHNVQCDESCERRCVGNSMSMSVSVSDNVAD